MFYLESRKPFSVENKACGATKKEDKSNRKVHLFVQISHTNFIDFVLQ